MDSEQIRQETAEEPVTDRYGDGSIAYEIGAPEDLELLAGASRELIEEAV